ncbi:NAD(P)H-dependent oxidoreductase [Massilia pinisoli]|uniref:NAD(P)H-dependent oxidoreductase n=1 Tax=Massilia pinisoli TaxID=1772194 RepID=A0ABT1ZJR4_9BURK|nr:NAD(P)H-dependent oxidoreductase [Massilia pinisoli]MCS0580138.1 NAD(P)H-dependent oxidoreductase [Massilia pinisoli]
MTEPTILVIYAHPAPHRSPIHRRLAETARALPGVDLCDLYEAYPDFDIDGERERARLAAARLLVFLHPFRWYGMPAIVKEWMDVVLQPGWAYNDDNHTGECALRGKTFWLVTTTGSGPDAYGPGGLHGRPFADFLPPYEATAALCGMGWIAPLVLHGAAQATADAIDAFAAEFRHRLEGYAGLAAAAAEERAHGA